MRVWRMRTGISFVVSPTDRARLAALISDRNSLQKHVWRAEIVLLSAAGAGTVEIMRRTGKSKTCVWRWQERFAEEGFQGLLRDKPRPSRIPPLGPEVAERVVALTLADPPGETTHWTADMMATTAGISASAVRRIWKAHGLQPHRWRRFKLSNDPKFVDKLRDVVGLYVARLQAPRHDHAVRGPEHSRRHRHRAQHAASSPSGVHPLPQRYQCRGPGRQGSSRHPRQLRRP